MEGHLKTLFFTWFLLRDVLRPSDLNPVGIHDWKEHEEVSFHPTSSWKNVPENIEVHGEASFEVKAINEGREGSYKFYLLLVQRDNQSRVVISENRDYEARIADLGQKEWSEWIARDFQWNGKLLPCVFRFRPISISSTKKSVLLYLSPICPKDKISEPEEYGALLSKEFGPYCDVLNISKLVMGWLDPKGLLDEFRAQGHWQAKAALKLVNELGVSLVFSKWHCFDKFYHFFFDKIDPVSPAYTPNEDEYYEEIHREMLKIADEMVGIVLDGMDKETCLIVVSDHGQIPSRRHAWVNNLLAKHGYIALKTDEAGNPVIDWSRTRAIMFPFVQIWVNLKGRDPEGTVKPGEEYEKLRDEIVSLLRGWRDTETGEFIMADVFKIEDGAMYGLWGERDGDIRFFTNPGYTVYRSNQVTKDGRLVTSVLTSPYRGDHGSCRPTTRFGRGSETALFAAAGAGIREGVFRKAPIRLCDITPTICKLLNVPPPAQCEGAVLSDILTAWAKK